MKIIRVPEGNRIEAFDGPTAPITTKLMDEIMLPVRQNKLKIISCAYEIESILEQVIATYFFGKGSTDSKRTEFVSQILTSSWCSFESKRKLALYIVDQTKTLTGKSKDEYERLLRKTISFRNAFTHGSLSTDGRRVKLEYFEGAPRHQFVTDEWLSEIEEALSECFSISLSLLGPPTEIDELG
jgi:hypothetical protein